MHDKHSSFDFLVNEIGSQNDKMIVIIIIIMNVKLKKFLIKNSNPALIFYFTLLEVENLLPQLEISIATSPCSLLDYLIFK